MGIMDDLQFAKLHARDNSDPEISRIIEKEFNRFLKYDKGFIESLHSSISESTDIILNGFTYPHNAAQAKEP